MTAAIAFLLLGAALSIGEGGYRHVSPLTNRVSASGISLSAPAGEPLRYTDAAFLAEAWVERAKVDADYTKNWWRPAVGDGLWGYGWTSANGNPFRWIGLAADVVSHEGGNGYRDGCCTFVDASLPLAEASSSGFVDVSTNLAETAGEAFAALFGEAEPWVARPEACPSSSDTRSGGPLAGADVAGMYLALTNLTRVAMRTVAVPASVNLSETGSPTFARWTRSSGSSSAPSVSETTEVATNAQWTLQFEATLSCYRWASSTTEGEAVSSQWSESRTCVYAPWDGTDAVTAYAIDLPDVLSGVVPQGGVRAFFEVRRSMTDQYREHVSREVGASTATNLVDRAERGVSLYRAWDAVYDADANRVLVLLDAATLSWTRDALFGGALAAAGAPVPTLDAFLASVQTPSLASGEAIHGFGRSAHYMARLVGFTVVLDGLVFRARTLGGD